MEYQVALGPCGPTECCLNLVRSDGEIKTFGPESLPWLILDHYWDISTQSSFEVPEWLGEILWWGQEAPD